MSIELAVVDDCWNRIGVRGDRSCPELKSAVHCQNCRVFSAASQAFFDRPHPAAYKRELTALVAEPPSARQSGTRPVVVFGLGEELFALDTRCFVEVTAPRRVHRVAHRHSRMFSGLVSINGQLELCFSLASLLHTSAEHARSRLLVQDSVYDRFLALLEPAVKAFRVEDPSLPTAEMGPLISSAQRTSVASYVGEADQAFAGTAPTGDGWWFPPTVLLAHSPQDRHWREEVFGPVLSVLPFRDEAEAIRLANDTEYGLSGSVWTRDLGQALRVSQAVETGALSVNSHSSVRYWTPFGGMKQSGLGRELGPDALHSFTDVKNVFINTDS